MIGIFRFIVWLFLRKYFGCKKFYRLTFIWGKKKGNKLFYFLRSQRFHWVCRRCLKPIIYLCSDKHVWKSEGNSVFHLFSEWNEFWELRTLSPSEEGKSLAKKIRAPCISTHNESNVHLLFCFASLQSSFLLYTSPFYISSPVIERENKLNQFIKMAKLLNFLFVDQNVNCTALDYSKIRKGFKRKGAYM